MHTILGDISDTWLNGHGRAHIVYCICIVRPLKTQMASIYTMYRNGNFGLVWGNTTHIHDFCIPLDFLGIKERPMKANRDKVLRNYNSRTKNRSRGSKNFIWQKIDENQKNSLVKNLQLWFLSIFCQMKFFDPRDPFLVLELSFLKRLSQLAFKALYKTSKHVGGPLFNL